MTSDDDLTEEAIALLLHLSTRQITTIFDTGFLFPSVAPSYLKARSLPALAQGQLTKAESGLIYNCKCDHVMV